MALLGVLTMLASAAAVETLPLSGEWLFTRDASGDMWSAMDPRASTEGWETVEVPHDWAIAGPFIPNSQGASGKLPWVGAGWYRRTFEVSGAQAATLAADGRAYLEFDGVMADPHVFLNGKKVGVWDYGYMSFRLDATKFLKEGQNLLAVQCRTWNHRSRWYPGAGIYRDVRLRILPKEHVVPGTLFIRPIEVSKAKAVIEATYENSVKGKVADRFEVANPRLWDVEDPYLYTYSALGESVRYGIRTAKFTADDGFHLNGRRLDIHGVDLHSDLGPLGMAFNRSAMARQLRVMKEMGVNALRTSHNAPDPQVLELCDEMGIVVWNECFDKWDGTSGRAGGVELEDYVCRNLAAFVRRDRNHPSVVLWSIGNEIDAASKAYPDGMTKERSKLFAETVRALDPTRPVGAGCCHGAVVVNGALEPLDVVGWNYIRGYEQVRAKYPAKPLVYSESASALSSYGFYENPIAAQMNDLSTNAFEVSGYDHISATWSDIADVEFARMEKDRYVAGEFVWTGIDYLGEPTPYTSAYNDWMIRQPQRLMARSSYFGIADLCAIPKDRYWLYRAHWNARAETCHLVPAHWNFTGARTVPVFAYTSGDEAELFLNGRSLGRRRKLPVADYPLQRIDFSAWAQEKDARTNPYYAICDRYRLRWFDVPYEPGELKVVAYRGGKRVGEDVVLTAAKPVAVKLTPESRDLPADGRTLAFVQVDLVDANGVRDALATNRVRFRVEGPAKIMAVGNGNARGYDSFKATDSHPLYFGKALVILRRDRGASGPVRLVAEADGLKSASMEF